MQRKLATLARLGAAALLVVWVPGSLARAAGADDWKSFQAAPPPPPPPPPAPAAAALPPPPLVPVAPAAEVAPNAAIAPDAATPEAAAAEAAPAATDSSDGHSPGTAGADLSFPGNLRLTSTTTGATGLFKLSSAELGRPGVFRVTLWGEYFTSNDFPATAQHDTRTVGAFTLDYTFAEFLEAYFGYRSSANTNSETNPRLLQAQGDLSLGLKAATEVATGLSLGADLRVYMLPGVGSQALSGYAFGIAPRAIATYDVRKAAPAVPLRAHLNVGLLFDKSKNLIPDHALNAAEQYALGINQFNRLSFGLGVDVPLPWVSPFVEWNFERPLNAHGLQRTDGTPTTPGAAMPQDLTLGLKLTAVRDFTLLAGVQLGLARSVALGIPGTPKYNLVFGLSYNFDPFAPRGVRVVEKTTVVEKPVEVVKAAPPTTGKVSGTVIDAGTQKPLGEVIITVAGAGLPPVASDGELGKFVTHELPAGTLQITFARQGYKPATLEAMVEAGKVANLQAMLVREAPSEATVKFNLVSDKRPIAGRVALNGPKKTSFTAGGDGAAQTTLPKGHYVATVESDGCLSKIREFDVPETGNVQIDFELAPMPKNPLVAVKADRIQIRQQVHFATGKADILPDSDQLLEQVVDAIVRNNIKKLRIDGHTDNRGAKEANLKLSGERAQAVADFLVRKGIERARVSAEGYGDTRPIAPNLTQRGRDLNRRVEIVIVDR